jgi:SAM-dependent methyltransferase
VAAEKDPLHLRALRNRFLRTPNVVVQRIDPESADDFAGLENCFDTVLCINVLEYLDAPREVVRSLCAVLKPYGALIVLVPQGPGLFGTLDRSLGHKRRFRPAAARELLEANGLAIQAALGFNRAGTLPWFAYSRFLGSRHINKAVLKIFDKTVWFWRRLDRLLPWPALSLILVAHKPAVQPSADAPAPSEAARAVSSPHAT